MTDQETSQKNNKLSWSRIIPLLMLIVAIGLAFYFRLDRYLSFDNLKQHRHALLAWTNQHYIVTVLSFMALYIVAVALSLPGAVFLTLTSGFLFGIILGTIYTVVSATLGSTAVFIVVRFSLGEWLEQKAYSWAKKMQKGFQNNAFQYLLFLRLVPLFPFWVVNIVPAVFNVRLPIFMLTTFLGIMPGSFVYVLLGNGLGHIFDKGQTPNLGIILEPQILAPLVGLGILALIPTIYKQIRRYYYGSKQSS